MQRSNDDKSQHSKTPSSRIILFGLNADQQLVQGANVPSRIMHPIALTTHKQTIDSVVCNRSNTFYIMNSGNNVHVTGVNKFGQCARLTSQMCYNFGVPVRNVSTYETAWSAHTIFVLSDGSVYSCGCCDVGQIGLGRCFVEFIFKPVKVPFPTNTHIIESNCGASHTVFIASDEDLNDNLLSRKLYVCGSNRECCLGFRNSDVPYCLPSPTLLSLSNLDSDEYIAGVSCGEFHTVVWTSKYRVYSWGRNASYECGFTDRPVVEQPSCISDIDYNCYPIIQVSCGCQFSVFLTKQGQVLTCGLIGNTRSKLTLMDQSLFDGHRISLVHTRYYHTIYVSEKPNIIYGSGSNENFQVNPSHLAEITNPSQIVLPSNDGVEPIWDYEYGTWSVSVGYSTTCLLWKKLQMNKRIQYFIARLREFSREGSNCYFADVDILYT
jgi:alpha-tubulin suppressor-like RCC1 family protein